MGKLRRAQLGYTFNRQKPLGNYIADFYCKKLGLVIEIDGSSHKTDAVRRNDVKKQEHLAMLGLEILRFTESEMRHAMNDVLRCIMAKIAELAANGAEGKSPAS